MKNQQQITAKRFLPLALLILICPLIHFGQIANSIDHPNGSTTTWYFPGNPVPGGCITPYPTVSNSPERNHCPTLEPCNDPAIRNPFIPGTNPPVTYFNLHWTVFNSVATASQIQALVNELNNDFSAHGIAFCYSAITHIGNSPYTDMNVDVGEDEAMKKSHANDPANTINVYVVNDITLGGVSVGGYAVSPNAPGGGTDTTGGIVITGNSTNHILSHEMGHIFGLEHTFYGIEEVIACGPCYESLANAAGQAVDGDNTGDWCSDTDPHTSTSSCNPNFSTSDSCSAFDINNSAFDNIMSYSNCRSVFTPQQAGRMHCFIKNYLSAWASYGGFACADQPHTDFSMNQDTVCENEPVIFTDQSNTNPGFPVTSYLWDFGDSQTSTVQNPTHAYSVAGTYTISLTTTNANGSTTRCKTVRVFGSIQASIVTPDQTVCEGFPVVVNVKVNGYGPFELSYTENGTPKTKTIATHLSGTYAILVTPLDSTKISLTSISGRFCDAVALSNSITLLTKSCCEPDSNWVFNGDFSLGNTGFYTDLNLNTNNNLCSHGGLKEEYLIDVDYANAQVQSLTSMAPSGGNFMMTLVETTGGGGGQRFWYDRFNVDSSKAYIFSAWVVNNCDSNCWGVPCGIGPPNIYLNIWDDSTKQIIDQQSINLNSSFIGQWIRLVMLFEPARSGRVRLEVENRGIANTTNWIGVDDIVFGATLRRPDPGFTTNLVDACAGQYDFTSHETDPLYDHHWDFGDGNSDTVKDPRHRYILAGTYQVIHTVSTDCWTEKDTTVIVVDQPLFVDAGRDTAICEGEATIIGGFPAVLYNVGNVSYQWAPNIALSDPVIEHPLAFPDTTNIYVLSVTDQATGCMVQDDVLVTINPTREAPEVYLYIGDSIFCEGKEAILCHFGVNLQNDSILWSQGTNNSNCITVDQSGQHYLTRTTPFGCKDQSNAINITVYPNPDATISPPGPVYVCEDGTTILSANVANVNYSWSTGSQSTGIGVSDGGLYSLTVTDSNGCQDFDAVQVYQLPGAGFTYTQPACIGSGIDFTPTCFDDSTFIYNWVFGPNANPSISTDPKPQGIVFNTPGLHPVTLRILANGNVYLETKDVNIKDAACCRSYKATMGVKGDTTTITGNAIFNGTYQIKGDLRFSNGTFQLKPGTVFYMEGHERITTDGFGTISKTGGYGPSIFLENATLLMNDATITADCDTMWGGIISNHRQTTTHPYALNDNIIIAGNTDSCEISHSSLGIRIDGVHDGFTIRKTKFLNNYFGIYAPKDFNTSTKQDFIQYNRFYSHPDEMLYPYNKVDSIKQYYTGIAINLERGINLNTFVEGNRITNCMFGIFSGTETSPFDAQGNTLENNYLAGIYFFGVGFQHGIPIIKDNFFYFPDAPLNTAQVADPAGTITGKINLAQTTNFNAGRTFGIVAPGEFLIRNNYFFGNQQKAPGLDQRGIAAWTSWGTFDIQENKFYNLNMGVASTALDAQSSQISNNLFESNQYGVFVESSPFYASPDLQLHCNTFDQGTAGGAGDTIFGIYIDSTGYLNDQGDCDPLTPLEPAGNKYNYSSQNWYSISLNDVYNFNYYHYNDEIVGNVQSSGAINLHQCADSSNCMGSTGTGNLKLARDEIECYQEALQNPGQIECGSLFEKAMINRTIQFNHAEGCTEAFEKVTEAMLKAKNQTAYNAFAWHLVDCRVNDGRISEALTWKTEVMANNKADEDMQYRDQFYDTYWRINHITTDEAYQVSEADIKTLEIIAQSTSSFALPACYLLFPIAPSKAICSNELSSEKEGKRGAQNQPIDIGLRRTFVHPNPFSEYTILNYDLSDISGKVTLIIWDVTGRFVKEVTLDKDAKSIIISGKDWQNGVYVYNIYSSKQLMAKGKMVLIK